MSASPDPEAPWPAQLAPSRELQIPECSARHSLPGPDVFWSGLPSRRPTGPVPPAGSAGRRSPRATGAPGAEVNAAKTSRAPDTKRRPPPPRYAGSPPLPHPPSRPAFQPRATRLPRRAESRCCARLKPRPPRVATPPELRLCRPHPTLCPRTPNSNDPPAAPGAWLPESGPTRLGAASKPGREVCMGAPRWASPRGARALAGGGGPRARLQDDTQWGKSAGRGQELSQDWRLPESGGDFGVSGDMGWGVPG